MKKTFSIIYIIMKNKIYLNKFNFIVENKKEKNLKLRNIKEFRIIKIEL